MSKRMKVIIIISAIVIALSIIIVGLGFMINELRPKTYSSAKSECEKVLDRYQTDMEKIAVGALSAEKNVSGEFKEYYYSCYKEKGLVSFDIDAQGMLGGQYWNLTYTQDGTFNGKSEFYHYEEASGNNIIKAERINENWWYVWTDYDGTEKSYK